MKTQTNTNPIWNEQFKIRPRRNASKKHEIIKLLIVLNLIEKYKKELFYIRIYTEYPVIEGKITDVFFQNNKTKEIICYEIQKNVSEKWLNETKKSYENYNNMFFKIDWSLVREKDFPENIEELNNKIKEILI